MRQAEAVQKACAALQSVPGVKSRWLGRWTHIRRKATSRALNLVLVFCFFVGVFGSELAMSASDENDRFKSTEVRVIRPRYFNKRKRFELGGQFSGVMNETFIYTFMASGIAAYHFTETFALELQGAFGISTDKEDKRLLFEEFEIKTKIFRTLYSFEGAVQWTPMYGKWQLPSGRLIYFDTYVSVGGGMTGIDWKYSDFCTPPKVDDGKNSIKADQVKSYPSFLMGVGQRYFLNKELALRWDIRNHSLMYEKFDAECVVDPTNAESGGGIHNTITFQLGASKFF